MSKRSPRKFKKACKIYKNGITIKTKLLRYIHERYAVDWYCEEHADMFETNRY